MDGVSALLDAIPAISRMLSGAADPQAAAAKLTDMLVMLDSTIAATRRVAADLRPLLLDGSMQWRPGSRSAWTT